MKEANKLLLKKANKVLSILSGIFAILYLLIFKFTKEKFFGLGASILLSITAITFIIYLIYNESSNNN